MSTRPTPDLTITETRVYRGPNIWSYDKAIHLVVDLGSLEDFPTNTIPGFTDNLLEMLPGLREHSCSRGKRGGFVERLDEGTWLGHVAEHAALALEQVVGHDIRRGKTRGVKGQKGVYNVIFGYADEQVGLAAARLAVRLVNHLVEADPEFDWDEELERFILRAERTAFGPSTQAILDEAMSRDIPWLRLNQYSLVQLGQGVHAKRIRATMTSATARSPSTSPPTRTSPPGCWRPPGFRCPSRTPCAARTRPSARPSGSASPASSSRSTATTAAASASTSTRRRRCGRRSPWRWSSPGVA